MKRERRCTWCAHFRRKPSQLCGDTCGIEPTPYAFKRPCGRQFSTKQQAFSDHFCVATPVDFMARKLRTV